MKEKEGYPVKNPPVSLYHGLYYVKVGTLPANTNFWFPPNMQMLSGVVIYQGCGSTYIRARVEKPLTEKEVVEDLNICSGTDVMVSEEDYEKTKFPVRARKIHRKPGMEGFPAEP